ncbi:phosphotriesterase-related protein [Algoriphagus boseongensis]|uniref:Phosphotriesterase-related protein n=1 Tax=Algoriphagus boseongensis TaxID=1442587 RepID=A0A4R6T920_9BACT|nr:phosphotriesterase [Algoriphagus boseongensis]TDQ18332.1 phosphotriesterase-related protein [Algoriphagus boseongensis]
MKKLLLLFLIPALLFSCKDKESNENPSYFNAVTGEFPMDSLGLSLIHEHILVDFIGADSVSRERYNRDSVIQKVLPYLLEVKEMGVKTIFDCTPSYLGKDPELLLELSRLTGIRFLTNTGYYGAVGGKYLPPHAFTESAEELAKRWIAEFENGIEGTSIKPSFIKISVNEADTLSAIDQKLVQAAAITHLTTGLTIASHTGTWKTAAQEVRILQKMGVEPSEFVWVHAQAEQDFSNYEKAAGLGVWISLDGIGWAIEPYVERLVFAKEKGILGNILVSHDAGWYDPEKPNGGDFQPFTNIFEKLIPILKERGFSEEDWKTLLIENPKKAFELN